MAQPIAVLRGTALHAGGEAVVRLERIAGPLVLAQRGAEAGLAELSVVRADRGVAVASLDGRVAVDLVEHLLAALGGLGVSEGVRVTAEHGELPLLDGGARRFVEALGAIGAPVGGAPGLRVARAGTFRRGRSEYRFAPGTGVHVAVDVDFRAPVGRQSARWEGDPADFARRIAPTRTFGWADEYDALRAAGRARGVDLDAVLVLTGEGVLAGCRPAEPSEVARHKLLDLIGDLALHGGPPLGTVEAFAPGHAATHAVVAEALAAGVLAPAAPTAGGRGGGRLAAAGLAALALALSPGARAAGNDEVLDAPAPPTLPALAHRLPTYTFEYTAASIDLGQTATGASAGRAYAWFAHNELEVPVVRRKWYFGIASDVAAGSVPGVGHNFFLGNPELFGRGLWSSAVGLSSGGGLGLVVPAPRTISDSEERVLGVVRVVRPWDAAYFNNLTLTFRPWFDVRQVVGRFVLQLRQGLDASLVLRAPLAGEHRNDFVARSTFYAGYRVAKPLGLGLEVWEVYQISADLPDDKRAAFAISPSVRVMLPRVEPAFSVLLPISTPLRGEAASYFAARLSVAFNFDTQPL